MSGCVCTCPNSHREGLLKAAEQDYSKSAKRDCLQLVCSGNDPHSLRYSGGHREFHMYLFLQVVNLKICLHTHTQFLFFICTFYTK